MKLAMENAKEEEFRNLRIQLERMRREIEIGPENVDRVFQEDNEFHSIITSMGHNPLVQKIEAVVLTLTYFVNEFIESKELARQDPENQP